MPTARKPPTSQTAPKKYAPGGRGPGSSSGPMTKPKGTGGNGPIGKNTGKPYPKPKRGKY